MNRDINLKLIWTMKLGISGISGEPISIDQIMEEEKLVEVSLTEMHHLYVWFGTFNPLQPS